METKLERISQLSKENPNMVFTSIGHLINKEMLKKCHETMQKDKATGIDGITKEEYGYARLFMDDDEKQLWENSYTENGDVYELKALSKDELNNLDSELSGALIMNNQLSSVDEETFEKMMNQEGSQTKIDPAMLELQSSRQT